MLRASPEGVHFAETRLEDLPLLLAFPEKLPLLLAQAQADRIKVLLGLDSSLSLGFVRFLGST